jgi:NADH-quinone oxidoreductase subunit N
MRPIQITTIEYIRVLPELILTLFGAALMMAEAFTKPRASRKPLGIIAFFGAMLAFAASVFQCRVVLVNGQPTTPYMGYAFFDLVRVDHFSIFFHAVICLVSAFAILASLDWVDDQIDRVGEYYALILLGTVGMVLMSSAMELVLIFVALEISSIASYVLAGFRRRSASSAESALKYFLLGSFATAFFLYGVALIFGGVGTTNINGIALSIVNNVHPMVEGNLVHWGPINLGLVYASVALMFVGIGFKVAAAPFHVWTPDVYEGAPSPVVGLMSTAPKAAAFAVLLRIFFAAATPGWFWMVWGVAALSMTLGNIGALVQNNIKRLLAYSSIAHAGYLLVAFVGFRNTGPGGAQLGITAAIFYACSYAFMNLGAFVVVSQIAGPDERFTSLEDYAGLGRRSPVLAATLTIFLLSLIGIPLTGGFFAKFYVFSAALQGNLIWLTVIGVVNSAIAAYYYLRVIVVMYMREPAGNVDAPLAEVPNGIGIAMICTAAITIFLGVWPQGVINFVNQSARDLLQ